MMPHMRAFVQRAAVAGIAARCARYMHRLRGTRDMLVSKQQQREITNFVCHYGTCMSTNMESDFRFPVNQTILGTNPRTPPPAPPGGGAHMQEEDDDVTTTSAARVRHTCCQPAHSTHSLPNPWQLTCQSPASGQAPASAPPGSVAVKVCRLRVPPLFLCPVRVQPRISVDRAIIDELSVLALQEPAAGGAGQAGTQASRSMRTTGGCWRRQRMPLCVLLLLLLVVLCASCAM